MGVTPTGPGCEPTASAADASSQSRIPNAGALLALAERVEAAAGVDRELDADISIAIHRSGAEELDDPREVAHARRVLISHGARPGNYEISAFSGVSLRTAPEFTASLDAAMTLVPEGWGWAVNFDRGLARANVRHQENGKTLGFPVSAATPALALAAAALLARDTDRSGEADETAKQAQPKARAGAEGIAQTTAPPVRSEP